MKMKHRLVLGAITFMAAFTIVAFPLHSVFAAKPSSPQRTSALESHDLWRKLWEDHVTWTRVVIISTLDNLAGNDTYIARLLQNYEDMEDALAPYYGDDAEELGDLIKDHLVIAEEILVAARDGDTAGQADATARWYANAHDIAVKMSEMNPQYWPLSMNDPMWKEHLDLTLAEAVDHLTGNYTGEVEAYDQIVDLALEMADFMSNGVMLQFRNDFSGIQCVLGQGGGSDEGDDDDQGEDNDEQSASQPLIGFHAEGSALSGARTFQFELGQSGPVSLSIFDVSGRQVARVFEGSLQAGPHAITWDGRVAGGSDGAAGIYFARITAGRATKAIELVETKP